MDLADFAAWLRELDYAESTVRDTVREARHLLNEGEGGTVRAARRLAAYAADRQLPVPAGAAALLRDRPRLPSGLHGGHRIQPRRRAAVSYSDEDWRALAHAIVEDETEEARVLEVLAVTGLRIGDVLRLERRSLSEGLRLGTIVGVQKGGREWQRRVSAPWERLWEAWRRDTDSRHAHNVAGWICPTNDSPLPGDCAYKRVYRRLQELGQAAGVSGPIHPHRIRRTLAVMVLRETGNVHLAGQLLNHRPGSPATQRYVDELRPDEVAALEERIRSKYGV